MDKNNNAGVSQAADLKLRSSHFEQTIKTLRLELTAAKEEGVKLSKYDRSL